MEDRLSKLEKTVQGFNLVTSGVELGGGFSKLESQASIEERVAHLEQLHENFQIIGGANVTVEGSLKNGFAICSTCPRAADEESGVINTPPPVSTGACCVDGVCSIQTENGCIGLGGTYQGDGATCEPTGACCLEDNSCIITNEICCTDAGGTYQGDDTECDPDPCGMPTCPCVAAAMYPPFFNPDDGFYYSQRTDDSCTLMSTYSGGVLSTARFLTLSASMTACDGTFTGGSSCVYQINEECDGSTRISCSGEIVDGLDCIVGCDFDCDSQCGEGAPPHVSNVQTLSDQCVPP